MSRKRPAKPFWFQLYVIRDRDFSKKLMDRAIAAKVDTLVLTVDLQVLGQRHKDIKNGLSVPPQFRIKNVLDIATKPAWAWSVLKGKSKTFGNISGHVPGMENVNSLAKWTNDQFDPALNWKDVEWIKKYWPGKLIIKGILDVDDAKMAIDVGADAIVVSNHGGRQLDGTSSSIAMLPRVVDAVGDKTEILFDGGIRTGADIMRALALGARACLIGRSYVYGLGAYGQAGVAKAIDILENELSVTMALTGVGAVSDIDGRVIEDGVAKKKPAAKAKPRAKKTGGSIRLSLPALRGGEKSPPPQTRRDVLEDRLDHMRVVFDAKLVRHREQQRIRFGDALVALQLLDQLVGLGREALAEDGAFLFAQHTDLVLALVVVEIHPVLIAHQREDRARHRDARRARMPGRFPRLAIKPDLFGLLDVERLTALVDLERRRLQVHAELGRPLRRRIGAGAPPDALAQAFRERLQPQRARRIGKHRARIGLGEAFALQQLEKYLGVGARHVGVGLAVLRHVTEIAPAVDHLLGRTAGNAELQPAAGDEVGGAGVLHHVKRVLVAHVDDGGAELDFLGARAARRQQRKRRAELAGEMVDAKISPVGAQFLGRDRELDRLQQRVGGRAHLRLRRWRPVTEGEKADVFHGGYIGCGVG